MTAEIIQFPSWRLSRTLNEEDPGDFLENGEVCWECNCNSHLFFILRDGFLCRKCGVYSDWIQLEDK